MNKEYEMEMEREIYHEMLDIIRSDTVSDIVDALVRKRILSVKTKIHLMLDANRHQSVAFLSVGDEE